MCNFWGWKLHCDTCGIWSLTRDKLIQHTSHTPLHLYWDFGVLTTGPPEAWECVFWCADSNYDFAGGRWGLYFKQAPNPSYLSKVGGNCCCTLESEPESPGRKQSRLRSCCIQALVGFQLVGSRQSSCFMLVLEGKPGV